MSLMYRKFMPGGNIGDSAEQRISDKIKRIQRFNEVTETGEWDDETEGAYIEVLKAQEKLKDAGVYKGSVDGIAGPKTRESLTKMKALQLSRERQLNESDKFMDAIVSLRKMDLRGTDKGITG